MTLPPQKPQRRTVALRPRADRYRLPRFETREAPREWVQPFERPDPMNAPYDPDDQWEAFAWVAAAITFLIIVFLASQPTLS